VCTILIVDDDVDTRETLADNLRGQGHSVLLAMNGSHALELLELGRSMGADPCLALVDLTMPVMDGWALLAALDRDGSWRKLQVIVSSGADLSERPLSFAHALLVWPKPIDPEKLARIQDHCPLHESLSNELAAAIGMLTVPGEAHDMALVVRRPTTTRPERSPQEARARRSVSHHSGSGEGHRPAVPPAGQQVTAKARRKRTSQTP
jgi:CheY-like chemotaxis protein